jgi:hypothetical protein
MDTQNSAASTYLIQAYQDIHKYKVSLTVAGAIMVALNEISESGDEEFAESIAMKIQMYIRTVAA